MTNVARIDRAPSDNAVSPARPANADGARPAVAVEGVSKRFASRKGEVHAVDNVSLSIGAGEFVAILGPSGCGKTTLLRILAGLESASSGTVHCGGEIVTKPRPDAGVVFQQAVLLPWNTVLNNVMLPAQLKGDASAATRARAVRLLDFMGLKDFVRNIRSNCRAGCSSECRSAVP